MSIFVEIVIEVVLLGILAFIQLRFFFENLKHMKSFKSLFNYKEWELEEDVETGLIKGIKGYGNYTYQDIESDINDYISNNKGAIIDFQIIQDIVNRHTNSLEEKISSMIPMPLYLGLAGTMLGVVLGLVHLLISGDVQSLAVADKVSTSGITGLLFGIAIAMCVSFIGIICTTISSNHFKRDKEIEEKGKNQFLSWIESKLLPALPSNTSEVFEKLVRNLGKFNNTFKENTEDLRGTLEAVNKSYETQARVIEQVRQMDVVQIVETNARMLKDLQESTEKLERFNQYLDHIEGYTNTIQRFNSQFNQECERLHVLEEIRDFFTRHKEIIIHESADIDDRLKKALEEISNGAKTEMNNMREIFTNQSAFIQEFLKEQIGYYQAYYKELAESTQKYNQEVTEVLRNDLAKFPQITKQLQNISTLPGTLEKIAVKIEQSNKKLVEKFISEIKGYTPGTMQHNPEIRGNKILRVIGTISQAAIAIAFISLIAIIIYLLR